MSKIYIGIDPDLKKSGWALWDPSRKVFGCQIKSVLEIIEYFQKMDDLDRIFYVIIIEAGWLNKKSNFRGTQNKAVGERIAKNVGENHATGKIIEQACQELGITYRLVKPTTAKVNSTYFEKLTGIKTNNQEMIDAGMLVYGI